MAGNEVCLQEQLPIRPGSADRIGVLPPTQGWPSQSQGACMRSHKHQSSCSPPQFPHRPWDKVRQLCALRPGSCPHLGLLSHFHCSEKPHFVSSLRPGPCCSLGLPLARGLPRDQARPVLAPLTLWCSHRPPPPPKGRHPSACPGALAQRQCAENPCAGNTGRDRGLQRGVLRPQSKALNCPPVAQTPQGLHQASASTSHSASPLASGGQFTHTQTPTYPQRTPSVWNSLPPALGLPLGSTPTPARRPCSPLCWGSCCLLLGGSALFLSQPESPVGPYLCGEWTAQRTAD